MKSQRSTAETNRDRVPLSLMRTVLALAPSSSGAKRLRPAPGAASTTGVELVYCRSTLNPADTVSRARGPGTVRTLPRQLALVMPTGGLQAFRRAEAAGLVKGDKWRPGGMVRSRLPRRASCSGEDVLQGRSLLKSVAVGVQTDAGHRKEVIRLLMSVDTDGVKMKTDAEMDGTMVEYFDEEFLREAKGHIGHRILADHMTVHPEFGPFGHRKQSRAPQALKGWDRLGPGYGHTPVALPVRAAIAVRLNARGYRAMGLWVLVMFGTYLLPGENHSLRVRDGSGLWDSPHLAWVGAFFHELQSGRRRDEPLVPFSAAELQMQLRVVTVELGLPDRVPHRMEAGRVAYCEMCDTGLRWMTRGAVFPFPPAVPRGGSWRTSSRGVAASAPRRRR
jgi:hypothetical protein